MLENTSVKQATFVEMTPKAHLWLLTVSDYSAVPESLCRTAKAMSNKQLSATVTGASW